MNNNKCVIYVVRHGQAKGNKNNILLGQLDVPLTELGKIEAEKAADLFKNKNIDIIYASDLKRAFETAEIIAKKQNKKVIKEKLLRERDIDTFENLTIQEAEDKIGNLTEFNALSDIEKLKYKFVPEMESAEDVVERFKKFLKKMVDKNNGKTILALTHGGLMLYFFISLKKAHYANLFGDPNPFDNLGYFKVLTDGMEFSILETQGYKQIK